MFSENYSTDRCGLQKIHVEKIGDDWVPSFKAHSWTLFLNSSTERCHRDVAQEIVCARALTQKF